MPCQHATYMYTCLCMIGHSSHISATSTIFINEQQNLDGGSILIYRHCLRDLLETFSTLETSLKNRSKFRPPLSMLHFMPQFFLAFPEEDIPSLLYFPLFPHNKYRKTHCNLFNRRLQYEVLHVHISPVYSRFHHIYDSIVCFKDSLQKTDNQKQRVKN